MKVEAVKRWMKANRITQEAMAAELGYAHRVTVATNLSKDRDTVSPEFLGRMMARFPDATVQLLKASAEPVDQAVQPECA